MIYITPIKQVEMKRLLLFRHKYKKCKITAHSERSLLNYSYICNVAEKPSQT